MINQYKVVLGTTEYDPVYIIAAKNQLAAVIGACHRFGITELEEVLARNISVEKLDINDPEFLEWASADAYCNDSIESIDNQAWIHSDYLQYVRGTEEVHI